MNNMELAKVAMGLGAIALGLIVLIIAPGCGATAFEDAHSTLVRSAQIVNAVDGPLAAAVRDESQRALTQATSLESYHSAIAPWYAAVDAERVVLTAIQSADDAVTAAENAHNKAALTSILGCVARSVENLFTALTRVRASLIPDDLAGLVRLLGAFTTCEEVPHA